MPSHIIELYNYKSSLMDINEKIECIRLVFQIFELDLLIKEYEQKMEQQDGPRECNQANPETPGN